MVALALGAGVGAAIALVYVFTATRLYRASMKLMVVPAQVMRQPEAKTLDPALAARYVPFIRNTDAIAKAIKGTGLNTPADQWKLRGLDRRLGTTLLKDAPVIDLTLDFPDSDQGRTLLAAIAAAAIDLNRQMLTQSEDQNRQFLQGQLATAQSSLEGSEGALRAFQLRARLADRQAELESLAKERGRLDKLLRQRELRAAELASSSASLAQELSGQPRVLSLRARPNRARNQGHHAGGAGRDRQPVVRESEPLLIEQRSQLAGARAAVTKVTPISATCSGESTSSPGTSPRIRSNPRG